MKMDWRGREATDAIRARLAVNLFNFNETILDRARTDIGTPGPPRSRPGDAPRVDSGRLRDSLFGAVDESTLESKVGSTEEHAVYTETGTEAAGGGVRMVARPWFTPAILETVDDAARELGR